jgi:serine phosphatase RsbU (regulator of sigma subunit)
LEPAASIGGDTFDYSLGRDVLHMSLTDAMGHGVGAALTASVCLGSLRGGRRGGATLLEQATETNMALVEQAANRGIDDFVTGLVARVDLRTGSCDMVNAGHVAPYLARGTEVTPLELRTDLPFGLFPDTRYGSTAVTLRPGDRLVLVTDGMLKRNAGTIDLPSAIARTRELHPREVVRALADNALEATGNQLSDDATILCMDWHGTHHQERSAVSGADPERASDPLI